jgi:hypothetical protein
MSLLLLLQCMTSATNIHLKCKVDPLRKQMSLGTLPIGDSLASIDSTKHQLTHKPDSLDLFKINIKLDTRYINLYSSNLNISRFYQKTAYVFSNNDFKGIFPYQNYHISMMIPLFKLPSLPQSSRIYNYNSLNADNLNRIIARERSFPLPWLSGSNYGFCNNPGNTNTIGSFSNTFAQQSAFSNTLNTTNAMSSRTQNNNSTVLYKPTSLQQPNVRCGPIDFNERFNAPSMQFNNPNNYVNSFNSFSNYNTMRFNAPVNTMNSISTMQSYQPPMMMQPR